MKLPRRKYSIMIGVLIMVLAISGWLYTELVINWKPPVFFPLNDQQANYTIFIDTRSYNQQSTALYSLRYDGRNALQSSEGKPLVTSILIGKSPVPLQEFVGKSVTVEGEFVYGDRQCIVNACTHFGNFAVFDIKSIQAKNI